MTITAIGLVSTDKQEYSRYYPDLNTIRATVSGIAGATGDILTVKLVQELTGREVATKLVVLGMDPTTAAVAFALETDCFDGAGIYRAKRGSYVVRASDTPPDALTPVSVETDSAALTIRIVPTSVLSFSYMPAVNLTTARTLTADATGIPGFAITGAHGVQEGGYPLQYDFTAGAPPTRRVRLGNGSSHSWGPWLDLDDTTIDPNNARLWNPTIDGYVFCKINRAALPTADATGYALLAPGSLGSVVLGQALDNAVDAIQLWIGWSVPLEPLTVGTREAAAAEIPPMIIDRYVDPGPWDEAKTRSRGTVVELPGRRILDTHVLSGFTNQTKVITLRPSEWVVTDRYNGVLEMVASSGALLPLSPTGASVTGYGVYRGIYNEHVGNFWHYIYTHGLNSLHDYGTILQAIAYAASIPVLLQAGRAAQGIYASESFNRDGVSLSRQFVSGQMGIYSAEIQQANDWLEKNLVRLRRQIVGIITQG